MSKDFTVGDLNHLIRKLQELVGVLNEMSDGPLKAQLLNSLFANINNLEIPESIQLKR